LIGLAKALSKKRDYNSAEPLYRHALEIYQSVFGQSNHNTAIPLYHLANLCRDKADYENAYQLYHQALAIFELKLGFDAPSTLQVRTDLKNLPLTFKIRRLFKPIIQLFK